MSAESLREALAALGLRGGVEARGALAVLSLEGDAAPLRDPSVRARALSLASEHGFTHLALEVTDARSDGAALHRD
ncbi:MAG TPA: hypothetical protein VFR95_02220 [Gemmatimonadaceae bacterium]|nr:hypothetical protein [Gemmatimonadaceae bacterium]